jgi:hypothetical protein
VEQLNASWDGTKRGEVGDVVAIRRLPGEDIVYSDDNGGRKGSYELASKQEVAGYTR